MTNCSHMTHPLPNTMNLGRVWELRTGNLIDHRFPEESGENLRGMYVPLSIFTATVLQVEDLSMPKADASTTFPKAPWPSVLPREARVKNEPKGSYDSLHQIRGRHALWALQDTQDSSAQARHRPRVKSSLYHIYAAYGYKGWDLYP